MEFYAQFDFVTRPQTVITSVCVAARFTTDGVTWNRDSSGAGAGVEEERMVVGCTSFAGSVEEAGGTDVVLLLKCGDGEVGRAKAREEIEALENQPFNNDRKSWEE